jgi:hypothetical protein
MRAGSLKREKTLAVIRPVNAPDERLEERRISSGSKKG